MITNLRDQSLRLQIDATNLLRKRLHSGLSSEGPGSLAAMLLLAHLDVGGHARISSLSLADSLGDVFGPWHGI